MNGNDLNRIIIIAIVIIDVLAPNQTTFLNSICFAFAGINIQHCSTK